MNTSIIKYRFTLIVDIPGCEKLLRINFDDSRSNALSAYHQMREVLTTSKYWIEDYAYYNDGAMKYRTKQELK